MRSQGAVLIVAGEPSGDRIGAAVARALAAQGVTCFGMGGDACAASGVRLVADLRASAAMGFGEVAARLPAIVRAYTRLARSASAERPAAAILVDYAEFNHRLGVRLRGLGIPVLRCVAPQVWAWRAGRLRTARRAFDRLAVILPFEEALWRNAGVDARYVGHPALEGAALSRVEARSRLGLRAEGTAVALLPGSRRHEVKRLAPGMLRAVRELATTHAPIEARLLLAPSLDEGTRRWLMGEARSAGTPVAEVSPLAGAREWLSAFDATLSASGTATLESALAGAPPVIVYRVSALTAAVARRLIRVPSIGLPNLVLGDRAYPELLQDDVEPGRMARALADTLAHRAIFEPLARELRRRLAPPPSPHATFADRIVALAADWLFLGDIARDGTSDAAPRTGSTREEARA